jgi:hypothetical protein
VLGGQRARALWPFEVVPCVLAVARCRSEVELGLRPSKLGVWWGGLSSLAPKLVRKATGMRVPLCV